MSQAPPRSPSKTIKFSLIGAGLLTCVLLVFCMGLARFVHTVHGLIPPDDAPISDGIVVLTGGSQRVFDAVKLLEAARGRRLLITGVHPATGRSELTRATGERRELIDCCIDLDYQALNTSGNAIETAKWAHQHGFTSLLIVTSSYHMPRTLLEMRRHMPHLQLFPYPIASAKLHLEIWWQSPATLKLLVVEYIKYMASFVRFYTEKTINAKNIRALI